MLPGVRGDCFHTPLGESVLQRGVMNLCVTLFVLGAPLDVHPDHRLQKDDLIWLVALREISLWVELMSLSRIPDTRSAVQRHPDFLAPSYHIDLNSQP